MQQERIPKEQIQKDIKNGVCKVIDGFFVYSDKDVIAFCIFLRHLYAILF